MRVTSLILAAGLSAAAIPAAAQDSGGRVDAVRHLAAAAASAYQDRRGAEETERLSRRAKLGDNGRLRLANIAGEIVITGGSGDDVSIEAVKRTSGDRGQLATVSIEIEERPGRVDVETRHTARRDRVSVDYTVTVPRSATVELRSVSGSIRVTGVRGVVRAEAVSGNVTISGSPRVEAAKSVSGDVELADVSVDSDLTATSVSGSVRARNVKVRALQLSSVSGEIVLNDVACDRLEAKSVSGNVEFSGTLAKSGRYDLNSHSGTIRLRLSGSTGFELDADTFSGSIRSEMPVTLGAGSTSDTGRRRSRGRTTRAVFGDGSAVLAVRTFSGNIEITKGR